MVYLKGAALFVTLLILAISQSEGGVIGDCWELEAIVQPKTMTPDLVFSLVQKDACVLDTVKGTVCPTPGIHAIS